MQLYYQPHRSRTKEAAFVQALVNHFSIQEVIPHNYPIPENFSGALSMEAQIVSLENNMPTGKRWPMLLTELQRLPAQVKVFLTPKQISCDVVIIDKNRPYYLEYHERQHRSLSIDRPRAIYGMSGEIITVPRYVQRFLRDMWRIENLSPFTIVWDDWFQQNGATRIRLMDNGTQVYKLVD